MRKELNIKDILVNPKNPRHIEAMSEDEVLVMKKLLETSTDISRMYDLICSIFRNGWFEELVIAVVFDSNLNKYVAWDGNRRLTALKILDNPKLATSFSFSKKQLTHINIMASKVDKSLFIVSCSIKEDFQSLAQYILSIHTKESSGLSWDPESKSRFEHLYGNKNKSIYQTFKDEFLDVFKDLKISTSTFERIINSTPCKEFLKYEINNNILTSDLNPGEFKKQLQRIVNDIASKSVHSRNMNKVSDISNYLYKNIIPGVSNIKKDNEVTIKDVSISEDGSTDSTKDNNNNNSNSIDKGQINIFTTTNDTPAEVAAIPEKSENTNSETVLPEDTNVTNSTIGTNSYKISQKNEMPFSKINISSLDHTIDQAKGIYDLAFELQNMSKYTYKFYPIAYTFLIRSILEQSIIYFINKKGFINHITNQTNNRICDLGKLIEYVERRKDILISDLTVKRLWDTCFNNYAIKDYFDIIVHNPHKVKADPQLIKRFLDAGLFVIIQNFINS